MDNNITQLNQISESITVEELIEILSKLPQKSEVWMVIGEGGSVPLEMISTELDRENKTTYIALWGEE